MRRAARTNLALAALAAALGSACGDGSLDLVPLAGGADAAVDASPGVDASGADAHPDVATRDASEDTDDRDDAGEASDARYDAPGLCGGVVCAAPTPVCDRVNATCVQCLVSTDCALGHCEPTHRCEL